MKTLAFCLVIAAACCAQTTQPTTQETSAAPTSRDGFLHSKVEEVRHTCKDAILAVSKDPDAVKFLDEGNYEFGRGLMRNDIVFVFETMGRNSYGAVLRHTISCTVTCKEKGGCRVPRVAEY